MLSLLQRLRADYPEEAENVLYAAILTGQIEVNGVRERRPGRRLRRGDQLAWQRQWPYASRGGDKLEAAVRQWRLPVAGRVLLDAGASTGGFTDCLLRHGARLVYAVDCGRQQLRYRLRCQPQVLVHEQTPIQAFAATSLRPDWAVADLSFRTLRGVVRLLLNLTNEAWAVVLCKPQFEWQQAPPEFKGVVDRRHHAAILHQCQVDFLREGVCVDAILPAPLTGRHGNLEYLLLVRVQGAALAYRRPALGDWATQFVPGPVANPTCRTETLN